MTCVIQRVWLGEFAFENETRKMISTRIESGTNLTVITGGRTVISGTEDELVIRFKLLVEPRGVLSAMPAELDELDAKLGRRYT
jgi:hypothetical protein